MIRKFECKTCEKQFDADDQGSVICPYCQSDNVEPSGFHLPSWMMRLGLVVVACVLGFVIWWLFAKQSKPSEETVNSLEESIFELPTVEANELHFDGKNYSIDIIVKNLPKNKKCYFVCLNHFGDKEVLQKSKDGHFSDIPYCEDDGSCYDFAIMDADADTLLCTPVPVTGFIRQVSVSNKMTEQELQALIDRRDPSLNGAGENDYLAPDYMLTFKGLPSDAVNIPTILAEVTEKLDMEVWQRVTVTALDYDEMNRIKVITLKIETTEF